MFARYFKEKLLLKENTPSPHVGLLSDMRMMEDCRIAVHLAADYMENPFHVGMWARHLDDSGVPWYVICREKRHMETLRGQGVRGVWAKDAGQLQMAMAPGVRAVLYANNSHKNIELLRRFPHLIHVQMLHGDSDKPTSFSPVTRNFDRIFVSGQLGQDRYAMNGVKVPPEAFVHVGRPQVKDRSIGPRIAEWRKNPVIGYMPTWFGSHGDTMLSSLDRAKDIIPIIMRHIPNAKILFKPHPLIYKDPQWKQHEEAVNSVIRNAGVVVIDKDADANSVYEQSDILVSDISSTMIDYLYSDRPMLVIPPMGFSSDQAWKYPSLGGSYLVEADLSNLGELLLDAAGQDSLAEQRKVMRIYAFGDDDRPADARFIEEIRKLAA